MAQNDGISRPPPEVTGERTASLPSPCVSAVELAAMLEDGEELALLDVREEGIFARGHLFHAVPLPLSRLELKLARLVPRCATRIVLCDADDGLAQRAAAKLRRFGYCNISVLAGGVGAWHAIGRELFAGVHVPSKAFGEHVEHRDGTPSISAEELAAKRRAGEKMVVLDSRPLTEFQRMSLPGALDCPGAELVHRIFEVAPDPRHARRRQLRRPHAFDHRRAVAAKCGCSAPRGRAS